MVNSYTQIKIKKETHKKLRKLKNLEEFQLERRITLNDIIEDLLEEKFKTFDNKIIQKIENH